MYSTSRRSFFRWLASVPLAAAFLPALTVRAAPEAFPRLVDANPILPTGGRDEWAALRPGLEPRDGGFLMGSVCWAVYDPQKKLWRVYDHDGWSLFFTTDNLASIVAPDAAAAVNRLREHVESGTRAMMAVWMPCWIDALDYAEVYALLEYVEHCGALVPIENFYMAVAGNVKV